MLYTQNARTYSPVQIAEIAGSIRTFGFANPILVDAKGDIVAGHGRLAAARQLGLVEMPVIPLRNLTEIQRRQLVLADNRIALNAEWDLEMLQLELKDLLALGADLSVLGFKALQGSGGGLIDANDVPELAKEAVSRLGDVRRLGDHRVICGDSTDAVTVTALLGKDRPMLMVTDLPYGVN